MLGSAGFEARELVEVADLRLRGAGSRTGSMGICFPTAVVPRGPWRTDRVGLSGVATPPGEGGVACSSFGVGRSGVTAKFLGRGLLDVITVLRSQHSVIGY